MKYAQIDLETGRCISVSYLSSEVNAEHMIPLDPEDDVQPGDIRNPDGTWMRPEPPPPPSPPESLEQKIARLEAELAAAREERLAALEAIAELYETLIRGGSP